MDKLKIYYHGTTYENSKNILNNGFNEGTYFAVHLEDAIGYGGCYVFEVALEEISDDCWQFISTHVIPASRIVRLTEYMPSKILYDSSVLREIVLLSNLSYDELTPQEKAVLGKISFYDVS